MDTLQFFHSPVDFQFGVIMNKALYEHSSAVFKLSDLLGKYLGLELLGHMVSKYLTL